MKNTVASRWTRLILGVLVLLFAGVIYSWSILKAPLALEFGWTPAQLAVNYTVTIICFCLGGLASGLLAGKISSRLRLLCAAILVFSGFFITGRLSGASLLPLYLSYGVMAGLGIGIVYNVVIADVNAWFPDRPGLSSGCLMMGFGFATLLLGNICGRLINLPGFGWRATFTALAAAIAAVLVLASLLIQPPPRDLRLPAPRRKKTVSGLSRDFQPLDLRGRALLKRPAFWLMFAFFTLLAALGNSAISFAKDFALAQGGTEQAAISVVGLLAVCNGLGRLTSGSLFDRFGARLTQYAASLAALAAPLLALWAISRASFPLAVVALCLCGFAFGFSPTLTAALVKAFYGAKDFPLNFSMMNLVLIPASFAPSLAGAMITNSGAYSGSFLMLLGFSLAGLAFNLCVRRP